LRAGLDEDQAAEVFQYTFTALFEHLDRIQQPERVKAWLATTARREALRQEKISSRTRRWNASKSST
jgi:DNA-directed RNA polymerase specialized sigma24 family protein